jgi:hypothetical protein
LYKKNDGRFSGLSFPVGAFPKESVITYSLLSVAMKNAGFYRTHSYGYSSGLSPDSLLLTLYEHKGLHHYSGGKDRH